MRPLAACHNGVGYRSIEAFIFKSINSLPPRVLNEENKWLLGTQTLQCKGHASNTDKYTSLLLKRFLETFSMGWKDGCHQ